MDLTINHVALTVNNLEESIDWYTSKIGFALIDRYQNAQMEIARIKLNSIIIELFQVQGAQPLPDYRRDLMKDLQVIGTKHLCIEVPDLDKLLPKMKAKGIEIVGETDTAYFGGRFIFIKDCNGILIELYQK